MILMEVCSHITLSSMYIRPAFLNEMTESSPQNCSTVAVAVNTLLVSLTLHFIAARHFVPVRCLKMKVVDMVHPSSSRLTSARRQALMILSSMLDKSCPVWDQDIDLKIPEHTSYHLSM